MAPRWPSAAEWEEGEPACWFKSYNVTEDSDKKMVPPDNVCRGRKSEEEVFNQIGYDSLRVRCGSCSPQGKGWQD